MRPASLGIVQNLVSAERCTALAGEVDQQHKPFDDRVPEKSSIFGNGFEPHSPHFTLAVHSTIELAVALAMKRTVHSQE
jgi:hypothetical protein